MSDDVIKTLRGVTWQGSADISIHKRHLNVGLPEFTGSNPDTITFSVRVSTALGVDPLTEITRLKDYERNGTLLPFVLGEKIYGRFRWLISKSKILLEYYDPEGNLTTADISLTITEYPER